MLQAMKDELIKEYQAINSALEGMNRTKLKLEGALAVMERLLQKEAEEKNRPQSKAPESVDEPAQARPGTYKGDSPYAHKKRSDYDE